MRRKYNWDYLKQDFILNKSYITLSSFFGDKQIPYNSYARSKAIGWLREKDQFQKESFEKSKSRLLNTESNYIERQLIIARDLQLKGLQSLTKIEVKTVDEARKLISTGIEEEQSVLESYESRQSETLSEGVKTSKNRFEGIVDQMGTEELISLLSLITREKEKRN